MRSLCGLMLAIPLSVSCIDDTKPPITLDCGEGTHEEDGICVPNVTTSEPAPDTGETSETDTGDTTEPIEDRDEDGVAAPNDCDDNDAALGDIADDNDCDGVVAAADCDDTTTELGSVWEDGDCDGSLKADDCDDDDPASTLISNDADCDSVLTEEDCDDTDPESTRRSEDADCDTVLTDEDCDDTDPDSTVIATDADCDGVRTTDDCDDTNPESTTRATDADCDTVVMGEDCDDTDAASTTIAEDADCDGVRATDDCDDTDSSSTTIAEDADCDGVTGIVDCNDEDPSFGSVWSDADCDGVRTDADCDDTDPTTVNDMDCDGVLSADDCNDTDPTTVDDMDCDGVATAADCDDTDPDSTMIATDADCDGVLTDDDCDDEDTEMTTVAGDADCDGVLAEDDCDDTDPTTVDDMDCDGVASDEDDDDNDPTVSKIETQITDQKVDIIFFVDQSASMADEASRMGSLYRSFICAIEDVTTDWQMILIGRSGTPECGWGGVLTPSTPDVANTFTTGATSGFGPGLEAGLEWSNLAIEQSAPGGCNEGFVRDDAVLYIIALTDEPDGSTGGYGTQLEQLIEAKGDPANIVVSAIAGDYPSGCGTAMAGSGYYQATLETGGVYRSICDNWGSVETLREVGHAWRQKALYLDEIPDLDSLTVWVDGVQKDEGWTYEADPPRVVFDSEPEVGGLCGSTDIYDCDLDCVPVSTRGAEANSECDSSCGTSARDAYTKRPNLYCEEFDFDGGDCDVPIGGTCGDGYIVDCALQCVREVSPSPYSWYASVESSLGDGFCDADFFRGDPILDCEEFDFDNGDCDHSEPDPSTIPSFDECAVLAPDVPDGDPTDDTAEPGLGGECMSMPEFRDKWHVPSASVCADYEAPDEPAEDDEPADESAGEPCTLESDDDGVIDCSGDCVFRDTTEEWTGDGTCDDILEPYDYHLDCAAFSFDGGDCATPTTPTPSCTDTDYLTGVPASEACCECGGGKTIYPDPDDECEDIHGDATDRAGRQCDSYTYDPSLCGKNNFLDFNSLSMCCACGGGSTSPGDSDICYAGEWDGADTTPLAPGAEVTVRYQRATPEEPTDESAEDTAVGTGEDTGSPDAAFVATGTYTRGDGSTCERTYQWTGTPYVGECEGCTWAFNIETEETTTGSATDCEPSYWLTFTETSTDWGGTISNFVFSHAEVFSFYGATYSNVLLSTFDYTLDGHTHSYIYLITDGDSVEMTDTHVDWTYSNGSNYLSASGEFHSTWDATP